MPVTPMHVGVGLLGKGAFPRSVSLTSFVASQFVVDAEVAYFMLVRREWPFHRWAHTILLGSLVGVIVGVGVVVIGRLSLRVAGARWQVPDLREAAWGPAIAGGLLGGLSHPVLDGIMHDDIQPLQPFATGNPFHGILSYQSLHWGLLVMAAVGVVLLAPQARVLLRSKSGH